MQGVEEEGGDDDDDDNDHHHHHPPIIIQCTASMADNPVLPMKSHSSDVTTSLDRKIHSRIFHERRRSSSSTPPPPLGQSH
jgi:hypothetical protein